MRAHPFKRYLAAVLAALNLLMFAQVPLANAAMLGTPEVLQEQRQQVDREQLRAMLDDQQVQQKLQEMGVDRAQVEKRIDSLTPTELAQFNQQLSEEPAGAGVVGIIVLFLVIFIITDMLCATDIFSFVKCLR
jgi:hypothetical protein